VVKDYSEKVHFCSRLARE